jgi:hypothetical protein
MKFVHVLVEGQTEETFLRDVITPYLLNHNIFLTAKIITTKRMKMGTDFKGGISNYGKIKNDILRLLGDSSVAAVTTLIDYYGLPSDFPGKSTIKGTNCFERVSYLEKHFADDIANDKFIPFLSLHEFEAYLFTSPTDLANAFPNMDIKDEFIRIREEFQTPEEINEGATTHPAARISKLVPIYKKALHGPIITKRIGLTAIRKMCPHFNAWISTLESLGE